MLKRGEQHTERAQATWMEMAGPVCGSMLLFEFESSICVNWVVSGSKTNLQEETDTDRQIAVTARKTTERVGDTLEQIFRNA